MTDNHSDQKAARRGRPFGANNPGRPGRQKGARDKKTIVEEFANRRHRVTLGGRKRDLSTAQLVLMVLQQKAMSGIVSAAEFLDRLHAKHDDSSLQGGYLVVPEAIPIDELEREAEILNRFAKPPPGYKDGNS